jgi:TM2 domain-containing membrane protein YozV
MALSDERKQEIIEEESLRKSVREPGIAAVLSFCFNGLGQIYNGQIRKGITIMGFSVIFMTCVIVTAVYLAYIFWLNPQQIIQLWLWFLFLMLSIIAVGIIGIYSIYDAYKGSKIKEAK